MIAHGLTKALLGHNVYDSKLKAKIFNTIVLDLFLEELEHTGIVGNEGTNHTCHVNSIFV